MFRYQARAAQNHVAGTLSAMAICYAKISDIRIGSATSRSRGSELRCKTVVNQEFFLSEHGTGMHGD